MDVRGLDRAKPLTVAELVSAIASPVVIVGDAQRRITCVAALDAMRPGALSFARMPYSKVAHRVGDTVIIAPLDGNDDPDAAVTLIKVAKPREYFILALHELVGPEPLPDPGVSPTATIAADARIGAGVAIGPGVSIGRGAQVGERAVLFGGVQVLDDVELGDGVVVQANTVIGAHGQSYARLDDGRVLTMPHFGGAIVGARSRIGANTTVVRGTLRDTVIGSDCSIGNNANIGHNTVVGSRCFIGPGVVLTGSCVVGDDTWLSAGAIVCGVEIGHHVTVGTGAVVTRAVPDHSTVNGVPARPTAALGS
jgi:UDP-3-O-[3-hydroxymyristoyl] glucosamine N-acyltransferase